MVYRLVPTYRFSPQSHFGMTDTNVLKGLGLGLVVAALILSLLAFVSLQKTNTSLANFVDGQDDKKKVNKNFWLMLVLPVSVVCVVLGGVVGDKYL